MIDVKLHRLLDEFLAESGWRRNGWLDGDYLHVYLRKNERWFGLSQPDDLETWKAGRVNCVELANLSDMKECHQLQGIFSGFLDYLESKNIAVYVENVGPEQLRWYFERRGYQRMLTVCEHSYYHLQG